MEAIFIVFFSEWLVMQYYRNALEQAVDIAAPLRKEGAAPEILCVRFQRSPYIDDHVLPGLLYTTFHAGRNTPGVLANNLKTF